MNPTPEQLHTLQKRLGRTGSQMAELVGYQPTKRASDGAMVADGAKWRKLTAPAGTASSKNISHHAFFYLAAQLALSESELAKVKDKQAEILAIVPAQQ